MTMGKSSLRPSRDFETDCKSHSYYQQQARKGLWGLVLFVLLSAGVYWLESNSLLFDGALVERFGQAPPVNLMNLALAVYAFAVLIRILCRMSDARPQYRGWAHFGYLGAFYLFYAYAQALDPHFWAIFSAGLTIFLLEYYHLWVCCREAWAAQSEPVD